MGMRMTLSRGELSNLFGPGLRVKAPPCRCRFRYLTRRVIHWKTAITKGQFRNTDEFLERVNFPEVARALFLRGVHTRTLIVLASRRRQPLEQSQLLNLCCGHRLDFNHDFSLQESATLGVASPFGGQGPTGTTEFIDSLNL